VASEGVALSLHTPVHGASPAHGDPAVRQATLDAYLGTLRLAPALGADAVVVHSGRRAPVTLSREKAAAYSHETLLRCAEEAASVGVLMVIENTGFQRLAHILRSPADHAALVDSMRSPYAAACLDVGHSVVHGWKPEEHVLALDHRLKHVHLQDTRGASDDHLAIGDGTLDLAPTLTSLARIGFTGRLIIEIHPRPEARGDLITSRAKVLALARETGLDL